MITYDQNVDDYDDDHVSCPTKWPAVTMNFFGIILLTVFL